MKHETLLKRYKNLGYPVKEKTIQEEVDGIINWLFEKHEIFMSIQHMDSLSINMHNSAHKNKYANTKNRFYGFAVFNCYEEFTTRSTCKKIFENPFDAKFDALRYFYQAIKFQYY